MKNKVIIFLLGFLLVSGCKTQKEISSTSTVSSDYQKTINSLLQKQDSYEKEISVYKDSIQFVKGLIEQSTYVGDSVSNLETSYAKSSAFILNGKLNHTLKNKDSIPSIVTYLYKYKYKDRKDSIITITKDSIIHDKQVNNNKTVVKELNWFQKFVNNIKYVLIGCVVGIIGSCVLYIIFKTKIAKFL